MYIEQPRELLGTPNVKTRAISSQASQEEGSTTIPDTGVGASAPKRAAPSVGDDMVSPAMKVAAVLKDGWSVTISIEDRCGEGGVIPLQQFSFGSTTLNRFKLASIVPLTMELVEQSVPQAEGIMQDAMEEAYGQMLDTAILSNSAAVPGVRPAGLLNGVTVAAGNTTGGYASVVADMKTLISALSANRLGIRPLLIINDQDAISASLLMNPLGQLPFQSDLAAGRVLGVDVISSQLVATGTATIVDCGVLATAFDGPMFRISQEATLTMANADGTAPTQAEDGSGAVGTAGQVPPDGGMEVSDAGAAGGAFANGQAVSMFQTYSEAIRGIWPTSWAKMRPNSVASLNTIKWA